MRSPDELLYESEASLRLVDHAIEDLGTVASELECRTHAFIAHVSGQPGGFAELSRTLLKAYTESLGIAERMNESHSVLEQATIDKLHHMHGKLSEVSSATEVATTDILNGLSRGVDLVDRILGDEGAVTQTRNEVLGALREELYGVMVHLQFQDITSQQLGYVSSLLLEMKTRMNELVKVFAPYAIASAATPPKQPDTTVGAFDPNATTSDATARQAVADEVFEVLAKRKTA